MSVIERTIGVIVGKFCHYTFCPFIPFVIIHVVFLHILSLYVLSYIPFVITHFVIIPVCFIFSYILSLYVLSLYKFCFYMFCHYNFVTESPTYLSYQDNLPSKIDMSVFVESHSENRFWGQFDIRPETIMWRLPLKFYRIFLFWVLSLKTMSLFLLKLSIIPNGTYHGSRATLHYRTGTDSLAWRAMWWGPARCPRWTGWHRPPS